MAKILLTMVISGMTMMILAKFAAVVEFSGDAAQLHGEQGREYQQHHGRQEDVATAQHGLLEFPGSVERTSTR